MQEIDRTFNIHPEGSKLSIHDLGRGFNPCSEDPFSSEAIFDFSKFNVNFTPIIKNDGNVRFAGDEERHIRREFKYCRTLDELKKFYRVSGSDEFRIRKEQVGSRYADFFEKNAFHRKNYLSLFYHCDVVTISASADNQTCRYFQKALRISTEDVMRQFGLFYVSSITFGRRFDAEVRFSSSRKEDLYKVEKRLKENDAFRLQKLKRLYGTRLPRSVDVNVKLFENGGDPIDSEMSSLQSLFMFKDEYEETCEEYFDLKLIRQNNISHDLLWRIMPPGLVPVSFTVSCIPGLTWSVKDVQGLTLHARTGWRILTRLDALRKLILSKQLQLRTSGLPEEERRPIDIELLDMKTKLEELKYQVMRFLNSGLLAEAPFDQHGVLALFRGTKQICEAKHSIKGGAIFNGITKPTGRKKLFKGRTPFYGSLKLADGTKIYKVHLDPTGDIIGLAVDEDGMSVKLLERDNKLIAVRVEDSISVKLHGEGIVHTMEDDFCMVLVRDSFRKVRYEDILRVEPPHWHCVKTLPEVCWKKVAFSSNGRYLVSVDYNNPNYLTIYDTLDFRPVYHLQESDTPIASMTFSDDSLFFAVTSQDRFAYIYDASTFKLTQKLWLDCWKDFDILTHERFFCLFSDEFFVVWFAPSRVVSLWDTRIWKNRQFKEMDLIGNVAFHPNNPSELVVRLLTGKIHRWDLKKMSLKKRMPEIQFQEPESALRLPPIPLSFSSKGAFLALCCHDHTVKIFDTTSWMKITELMEMNVNFCSYSKKFLATSYKDGTLCLWNTRAEKMFETICDTPIVQVACCPQGRYLVTVHECGTLSWWRE